MIHMVNTIHSGGEGGINEYKHDTIKKKFLIYIYIYIHVVMNRVVAGHNTTVFYQGFYCWENSFCVDNCGLFWYEVGWTCLSVKLQIEQQISLSFDFP